MVNQRDEKEFPNSRLMQLSNCDLWNIGLVNVPKKYRLLLVCENGYFFLYNLNVEMVSAKFLIYLLNPNSFFHLIEFTSCTYFSTSPYFAFRFVCSLMVFLFHLLYPLACAFTIFLVCLFSFYHVFLIQKFR